MKKNTWNKAGVLTLFLGIGIAIGLLPGCGDDPAASTTFVQIERLARPAINEGLVLSNAYLNAYNSIAPSVDLTEPASAVVAEASAVLTAIFTAATGAGFAPAPTANVAGGFLPDVMRIETNQSVAVGTPSYNASFSGSPLILNGGRKITDDVINITLNYLFNGTANEAADSTAIDDKISYYMDVSGCPAQPAGANPAAPGHKCLNGQTANFGAATFPFLAAAN